jgi:hypothetical protein
LEETNQKNRKKKSSQEWGSPLGLHGVTILQKAEWERERPTEHMLESLQFGMSKIQATAWSLRPYSFHIEFPHQIHQKQSTACIPVLRYEKRFYVGGDQERQGEFVRFHSWARSVARILLLSA